MPAKAWNAGMQIICNNIYIVVIVNNGDDMMIDNCVYIQMYAKKI